MTDLETLTRRLDHMERQNRRLHYGWVLMHNAEVGILLGRPSAVTRGAVVRMDVVEGLCVMERKYEAPK